MAHMAVYLRFRPRLYLVASSSVHSSSPISHFSSSSLSSSSSDSSDETPQNSENTQTSSRNAYSEVFANLKGNVRPQFQQPPRPGITHSQRPSKTPQSSMALDEIRKNFSEFSQRSANSSAPFQRSQGQPSLSLRSERMSEKSSESRGFSGKDTTRKLKETLKRKPEERSNAAGDYFSRRHSRHHIYMWELEEEQRRHFRYHLFPNEMINWRELEEVESIWRELEGIREAFEEVVPSEADNKTYRTTQKLWIDPLWELKEFMKMKPNEGSNAAGDDSVKSHFLHHVFQSELSEKPQKKVEQLRMSLKTVLPSEADSKTYTPTVCLSNNLDVTKDCMSLPPKKNLVEQYHHPDNMSSAEKLKAVRDEFRMSEPDCESPRVDSKYSVLAEFIQDESHVMSYDYEDIQPIRILERREKHLRNEVVSGVRILWSKETTWKTWEFFDNRDTCVIKGEVTTWETWEIEQDMLSRFPNLFLGEVL